MVGKQKISLKIFDLLLGAENSRQFRQLEDTVFRPLILHKVFHLGLYFTAFCAEYAYLLIFTQSGQCFCLDAGFRKESLFSVHVHESSRLHQVAPDVLICSMHQVVGFGMSILME